MIYMRFEIIYIRFNLLKVFTTRNSIIQDTLNDPKRGLSLCLKTRNTVIIKLQ
jgi:hypothetical protein